MKLSEAKHIVQKMLAWVMTHEGVEMPTEVIDESLEDLLKANTIVSNWNDRQIKKQKVKGGAVSLQMTINSRAIAALYTAIMNVGRDEENTESIIQYQNKYVFVIRINPQQEQL